MKKHKKFNVVEKPAALFLSGDDLKEMHLRVSTLTAARNNFAMVEESYKYWVSSLKTKYGLPDGKFDIDQTSGEIKPKVSNG